MLNVWRKASPPSCLFRTHHGANLRTGLAYLAQHEVVEPVGAHIQCDSYQLWRSSAKIGQGKVQVATTVATGLAYDFFSEGTHC